jgi:peptide/nickel transport system ATP-binding protein
LKILEVNNLSTYFYASEGVVRAVDGVSFSLNKGEALGLAGESGSGKTTTAFSIMRLIKPPGKIVSGQVLYKGENLLDKSPSEMDRIRWSKISIIFQGAMNALNPVYTVGDQIVEAIVHHQGRSRGEAWARAEELLGLVGIDVSRARNYPHEFSGGMKQRVMIAMALALNPDLVIADEPTTALDVIMERQILDLMIDLRNRLNLSTILITHDLSIIAELCDRVGIFYAGKIVESATIRSLIKDPIHPYSKGLLGAFPTVDGPKKKLESIVGSPPSLINPPTGCRFHPRCPYAEEICKREEPPQREIEPGRYVACHQIMR